MKILFLLISCLTLLVAETHGQGSLNFSNIQAPTHLGSLDGPLAGQNILAQMLAGPTPDSLAPVGWPFPHLGVPLTTTNTGLVFGGTVAVPGVLPCQDAFVKMVAWDGLISDILISTGKGRRERNENDTE